MNKETLFFPKYFHYFIKTTQEENQSHLFFPVLGIGDLFHILESILHTRKTDIQFMVHIL